ncbi:MAG: hypothetical protein J6J57_04720 [Alistipes sp.]|nr:hypothetical protein [Alistipes sp.]
MRNTVVTNPYGELEVLDEVKIHCALCKSLNKGLYYMVDLDVELPTARACSKEAGELYLSKLRALR